MRAIRILFAIFSFSIFSYDLQLRSSDLFRFSAADLGGLDTHAGDRSGAVGSGDHVAGPVLELVGKHCIAVESGGFGHILAIGEPDFVLALPLPMAAMRRALQRERLLQSLL